MIFTIKNFSRILFDDISRYVVNLKINCYEIWLFSVTHFYIPLDCLMNGIKSGIQLFLLITV